LFLSLGALITLLLTSFAIGWAAFGNQALTSPLGGSFEGSDAFVRLLIIGGYVFVTLLVTVGVAFLMSVITDVPLGAVGTAVMIVIISGILDAIEALGSIRDWLPGHYSRAWTDSLNSVINWTGMARGGAYAFVVFAVLVGLAFIKFDRKDITS
jgi:ABC-2 type transport system permease protein